MKYVILALLLILAPRVSSAKCGDELQRQFVGEAADDLAYIMKQSVFSKKVAGPNKLFLSIEALDCTQVARGVEEDGMHSYSCDRPGAIHGLVAKLFFDTLNNLGIFADAGMSQVHLQAKSIHCTVISDADAINSNPNCYLTAAWQSDCKND